MDDERLKKAIGLAQQAAEKDREGKYEEAFDLYRNSLENWHLVLKYQPNPQLKIRLQKKMEEYTTRAEQIKEFLDAKRKQPPQPVAVSPGGPAAARKDKGAEEGTEEDKLRANIQGSILSTRPNVPWTDIAGLEVAKEALQEAVILPTRFPNLFLGERKPWKGILLYGPPGTGKTHLAKACATESSSTFLSVSSADVISKWQGESEKMVRALFETARSNHPSVIFIDEVDSIGGARSESGETESSRRIKTEFLVQMEGMGDQCSDVLILGATNVPWELDPALRRRFERRVYIPLPDVSARRRLLEIHIGESPHVLTETDFAYLSKNTEGFSGHDIKILVRDALFQAVRKCRASTHFKKVRSKDGRILMTPCSPADPDPSKEERDLLSVKGDELLPPDLEMMDFMIVLEKSKPSVASEDVKRYEEWTAKFGVEGS